MTKFFEITTEDNKRMLINIEHIKTVIENTTDGTATIDIYRSGDMIKTKEKYDKVSSEVRRWQ